MGDDKFVCIRGYRKALIRQVLVINELYTNDLAAWLAYFIILYLRLIDDADSSFPYGARERENPIRPVPRAVTGRAVRPGFWLSGARYRCKIGRLVG